MPKDQTNRPAKQLLHFSFLSSVFAFFVRVIRNSNKDYSFQILHISFDNRIQKRSIIVRLKVTVYFFFHA